MRMRVSLIAAATAVLGWQHATEQAFHQAVSADDRIFIAFVEPSTPESQALDPKWMSIAESEDGLFSVDCSNLTDVCKDYDVASYPALRLFDGRGKAKRYRGPRTASSIISFLRRAARPPITALEDRDIVAFQSIDDVVIIARLNARDEHVSATFAELAGRLGDRASFGIVETRDASSVACYNNKDDEYHTISNLNAAGSLENFVDACLTPLIGEFTRRTEMTYLLSGNSLVYYMASQPRQREEYVDAIRPIAKMYKDYLTFVTVDATEYMDMISALGQQMDLLPAITVQNPLMDQIFPFPSGQDITPERVEGFVLDIVGGKVSPWTGAQWEAGDREEMHDEL